MGPYPQSAEICGQKRKFLPIFKIFATLRPQTAVLYRRGCPGMECRKYIVRQKRPTTFFVNNFAKCWSIFKILAPLDLAKEFAIKCHFLYHTYIM